ncbi:MAG TPA: DMT family transporter [Kofleriaceae bacterium]|nr:DMT family transporter [Kofleriaceae bacterium]
MTLGILFGLIAALGWGGADFLARGATNALGAFRTAFYMQLVGLVSLSLWVLLSGDLGALTTRGSAATIAWASAIGVLNAITTVAAYRAFEVGLLAVVAPICATYPAIAVVLAALSGEQLTASRALGILGTMAGVALVAIGPSSHDEGESRDAAALSAPRRLGRGVAWALCTTLTQGLTIWVVGFRLIPEIGSVPTVWVMRVATFSVLLAAALLGRRSIRPPSGRAARLVLMMGLLDACAYAALTVGLGVEQVSVVGVLGSLYGAVTGLLGFAFLRERLSRLQWSGFVVVCGGVVLLAR